MVALFAVCSISTLQKVAMIMFMNSSQRTKSGLMMISKKKSGVMCFCMSYMNAIAWPVAGLTTRPMPSGGWNVVVKQDRYLIRVPHPFNPFFLQNTIDLGKCLLAHHLVYLGSDIFPRLHLSSITYQRLPHHIYGNSSVKKVLYRWSKVFIIFIIFWVLQFRPYCTLLGISSIRGGFVLLNYLG